MKEQRVLVYQKNHKSQYLIFYCNKELIHPSCSMTLLDSYGVVGVVRWAYVRRVHTFERNKS